MANRDNWGKNQGDRDRGGRGWDDEMGYGGGRSHGARDRGQDYEGESRWGGGRSSEEGR